MTKKKTKRFLFAALSMLMILTTISPILPAYAAEDDTENENITLAPYFLVENFAHTKTRLAIALSKFWHTLPLIRHVSANSVILVPCPLLIILVLKFF